MARSISKEGLEQKIEKIEKAIRRNREQYEKLTSELEELHKKQKAIQSEELLKAISESKKVTKKSCVSFKRMRNTQVTEYRRKTKPELWKQIEDLEQKLQLMEDYLDSKGLLSEALEYIEKAIESMEELPFG